MDKALSEVTQALKRWENQINLVLNNAHVVYESRPLQLLADFQGSTRRRAEEAKASVAKILRQALQIQDVVQQAREIHKSIVTFLPQNEKLEKIKMLIEGASIPMEESNPAASCDLLAETSTPRITPEALLQQMQSEFAAAKKTVDEMTRNISEKENLAADADTFLSSLPPGPKAEELKKQVLAASQTLAFNSGDVLAAMQATVKAFPKSMEARLQMAKLLITQKGKGKETPEKNLASIEEEDPFEWRVAWTRGHAAFYNNKPEEAAPIFNLVLNELPGELAPRLALALAAEAANQPKDAIRFYEAVIKTYDRYSSAAFGLARCYLQNQQIDEAIKAFDRVPQTAALYKEAQIQKALTYCAKRTEEAFLKASEIITNLQLEAVVLNETTIKILSQAMEELEKGKRNSKAMRPSSKKVLGAALQVTAIKAGLEKAFRQLAVFAQTPAEKIGYADLANAIRPVTLL